MGEEILIDCRAHETRAAVVVQGAVQELLIERKATRGLVGNVYHGRIARVLPGMQSAFVDIGLERAAFLHVADVWQARPHGANGKSGNGRGGAGGPPPPIERLLFDGQAVLVQVIKDPIGTKGARLSTQISIAGRFLVYLPQEPHIGISQRIGNAAEREALRERLTRVLPADERGGYIIRTVAEEATDEELAADVAYLRRRWQQILDGSRTLPAPCALYRELDLVQRALRDLVTEETVAVRLDSREAHDALKQFAETYMPSLATKLKLHNGDRSLFDQFRVDEEIERALARRVELKSGGYLIIDQTEALTTIDVNTGGYVGTRSFDDTIFRTNLEAAHSIARQLRLRNLGGIIIVDFIDMQSGEHREQVVAELRRALSKDRTKASVNGFTALGLVEMTRKRTRESLAHVLCEPCPVCQGKGEVKTARTVSYDILREIQREARQFNPREFRILASQHVIDLFLEEESTHLAALIDAIGKPVSLQVESLYGQEQYDIILL